MHHFNEPIGLGTFPFSNVFSSIDQEHARNIVKAFIDNGGEFVETAPVYPINRVDLGKILSEHDRNTYFLATKCVTGTNEAGEKVRSGQRDFLLYQLEAEMRRLGVDYLDLFQAHILPEDTTIEELVETLALVRQSGKVRFIGLSNVTKEDLQRATKVADIDFVQNRFSFIHRNEHAHIEAFCTENGISLNPYQVIERGELTSNPRPLSARAPDDLRNKKHEYIGAPFQFIRAWVSESLMPICARENLSLEALMLAWTCRSLVGGVGVVGATSADQLTKIFGYRDFDFTMSLYEELESAYERLRKEIRNTYNLSVEEFRGLD